MGDKSPIQWTDATWSPTIGCTRVSAGCDSCYAFTLHDRRHVAWKRGRWDSAPVQYHQPFSHVQLLPERLALPLHWRTPRRIFVDSMADLFHEAVPDDYIEKVFATMFVTPHHTYQILTKRPERMREWVRERQARPWGIRGRFESILEQMGRSARERLRFTNWIEYHWAWPLPNVWLGTSVEDQAAADERIPHLLATPAAVRFLSCEPLLGPVDLRRVRYGPYFLDALQGKYGTVTPETPFSFGMASMHPVGWVIVGGESGTRARPMDLAWARTIVEQAQAARVATFVKQLGSVWAREHHTKQSHAGDPEEWPLDLCRREYPK